MSLFTFFKNPDLSDLHAKLSAQHAGSSRPDRFQLDTTHGVQAWYDTEHETQSGFGTLTAYRAITLRGDPAWRVVDTERRLVFLAQAPDAEAAMTLALRTWDRARQLRDQPRQLQKLLADLRRGRLSFSVDLADAEATPLSTLGFRATLEAAGLFDIQRLSSQSVLRMSRAQPLVAHVLYAAWQRQKSEPGNDTPVGYEAMC